MKLGYADRDLYWDADKKAVLEESDPRQAYLCIHKGAEVTEEFLRSTKCQLKDGVLVLPSKQDPAPVPGAKPKHWRDMNKSELEAYLTENGVAFEAGANKAALVEAATKFHETEVND